MRGGRNWKAGHFIGRTKHSNTRRNSTAMISQVMAIWCLFRTNDKMCRFLDPGHDCCEMGGMGRAVRQSTGTIKIKRIQAPCVAWLTGSIGWVGGGGGGYAENCAIRRTHIIEQALKSRPTASRYSIYSLLYRLT